MKKIGDYTARGVVTEAETEAGNPQKIPLFDGKFTTGYRVVEFKIWASDYASGGAPDCIGKLSKNDIGSSAAASFMRADDDNQIAWSGVSGGSDAAGPMGFNIIDPDNMIVEDLYVYARSAGTNTNAINYIVRLENYQTYQLKIIQHA